MEIQKETCTEISQSFSYNDDDFCRPDEHWPNDIKRALKCIHEKYPEPGFGVAAMRKQCKIPQKNFSSRFKYYVGYTPASYLKMLRIRYAKKLIVQTKDNLSISTIAFNSGYEYPSTFSSAFKSVEGVSPKEYWTFSKKK